MDVFVGKPDTRIDLTGYGFSSQSPTVRIAELPKPVAINDYCSAKFPEGDWEVVKYNKRRGRITLRSVVSLNEISMGEEAFEEMFSLSFRFQNLDSLYANNPQQGP